jgi:RsiW-degrading membrane proteinase PrsW (M82 family)
MLTILLAVAVPVAFLLALHWLDLYESERPRLVAACVGWGVVAFILSLLVNRFCIDILGFSRPFVSTRTAPFVEEVFKAGILIWLARRAKLTYVVDGAIYGFASGVGFAAIENLRYVQLFPDNPFSLIIVRDFSSALAHGTAAALTGIALGSFAGSAPGNRRMLPLLVGLGGAMTMHYLWNNFAYYSPLTRDATEWVLVGVGLSGVALVAATILWGLGHERARLHESLGLKLGVSGGEASLIEHMDDLDRLLEPIERRFGKAKCHDVANFLHAEAQLGLKQQTLEATTDPGLRQALAGEVAEMEARLDAARRRVGVYVMLYVRSIFPETEWSMWSRLAQALAKPWQSAQGRSLWGIVASRTSARGAPAGEGIYARLQEEIDARARAAALTSGHVHELPEPMRRCLQWVMAEVHVTVEHVATGLGHHEDHAHSMLNDLTARGFLHRVTTEGKVAFRARSLGADEGAQRPHIWQSLTGRTKREGGSER